MARSSNVRRSRIPVETPVAVSGSDSAIATEAIVDLTAAVPGSDSAALTEAASVSAALSSADTPTVTDAGTVSATVPGSDSGAATDTGVSSVTGSGSDTGTGTDGGTASVTASSTDSAAATEGASLLIMPPNGADTGTATDTGAVSATVAGSDSATGTEGQNLDTGATPVSGSDSGTVTDSGTVVDLTPPTPPAPTTGGGGMVDETSIIGEFRALTDGDGARAFELAVVTDLTVYEPEPIRGPRIRLPSRRDPVVGVEGGDFATVAEMAEVWRPLATADGARMAETAVLDVIDPAEEDALERRILSELGLSDL